MKIGSKNKKTYVLLIIVALLCVTIGYAVLNSTLTITGKTNIGKNNWDVHFENIYVTDGSVTPIVEPTITNNITISNFELTLDKPGDFYEFVVDVKNFGSIDAMIDSVEKTPNLTTEQQKYLNYIIEYQNGEQITTKQLVKAEEFVRLKVRVEYKKDIIVSDLPTNNETLILGFNVNYVQADESGISVNSNGATGVLANGDINEIGTIVTIGDQQFYTIGTEGDNVKLLSMYNLHVGSEVTNVNFDTGVSMNEIENPTGMQSSKAKGAIVNVIDWETEQFEYIFPWVGVTAFSSEEQHGENYSDYEGSIVEGYVNDYAELLESKFDVEIEEARLITKDELVDEDTFNCSEEEYSCLNSSYPWIYSTSYWSGSANDNIDVWIVDSIGGFGNNDYSDDDGFGVRPVIVISKSYF